MKGSSRRSSNNNKSRGSKRGPTRNFGALDLSQKVAASAGGHAGFGLEVSNEQEHFLAHVSTESHTKDDGADTTRDASYTLPAAGVYGGRSSSSRAAFSAANLRRTRLFGTPSTRATNAAPAVDATVAATATATATVGAPSVYSGRSRFSRASASMISRTTSGLARRRRSRTTASGVSNTTTATSATNVPAVHIVCALSENLARETCVTSLDAGSVTSMQVTKQANGQTYSETLAYLEILQPHEILLNEGRRNSQLARKILELYHDGSNHQDNNDNSNGGGGGTMENPSWNNHTQPNRHQRRRVHRNKIGPAEQRQQHHPADAAPMSHTTVVTFLSRAQFDQTKGAALLQKVVRPETCDAALLEEYILLSSAHAVLQYTQNSLGANLSKHCLRLNVTAGGVNRMSMDRSTLLQLELLVNSVTGKVRHSLIGTLDCTKTTVGSRLLRTNLMSPPTRVDTINSRLELVDTFMSNEDFFYTVLEYLSSLPDVDKMLTNIALVPRKKPLLEEEGSASATLLRIASTGISALVCVKTTLAALPGFASALQSQLDATEQAQRSPNQERETERHGSADDGAATVVTDRSSLLVGLGDSSHQTPIRLQRHHLLRAIIFSMMQPGLAEVFHAVSDIFTENTTFSRNANVMRHQECFALQCEENSMISVLRRTFLANVDDIYKNADHYADVYGFQVAVRYTTHRGYFLAVPADVGTDLPQIFLQPSVSGRFITCTTEEISSLNVRAQDNVQDLLLLTHGSIQAALDMARSHYDAIAALCDAVALLDMCHSFADNVSQSRLPWCRPVVSDNPIHGGLSALAYGGDGPRDQNFVNSGRAMMIRNGRYAIDVSKSGLASGSGPSDFIPNDTLAADGKNFTLVTGINGSGKSTYLKQVAIIVILAHCGSYVPAEQALIPIRDQLCTRIGNADDQENNISTFMLEMKETALICNNVTERSLVLVDELGRATSNEDGVAIAWSVSEYLLKKRAMTFFVTHYPQLSRLGDIYPSVHNMHLEASVSKGDTGAIFYTHKVKAGACSVSTDYGVELAAACGWPSDVLQTARSVESQVANLCPDHDLCEMQPLGEDLHHAYTALDAISQSLKALLVDERVQSFASMRSELVKLHQDTVPESDTELFDALNRLLYRESPKHHRSQSIPAPIPNAAADREAMSVLLEQGTAGNASAVNTTACALSQKDCGDGDSETSSLSTSSSESDSSDDSSTSSSDTSKQA